MARIRICPTRAPGLIPGLLEEISRATRPVVFIPESFTLACETEIVKQSETGGIFDLKIFSPSSLIREIRELMGGGKKRPISGDGQNMIVSQIVHRCREQLQYYGDAVSQPTLAAKIASQLDDFTRARLSPALLKSYHPDSRRTEAKLADLALIWEEYQKVLGKGFEDTVGQWMSAIRMLRKSGILRGCELLIYGFDYITHDLLNLVEAAVKQGEDAAKEIVIGLISDDTGADRDIFHSANDSILALADMLSRMGLPYTVQPEERFPPMDAGIAYVEKTIYALGPFAAKKSYVRQGKITVLREDPGMVRDAAMAELSETFVPDLSHVRLYYARNSYLECQHACQTLIDWHQAGVAWDEMAVAICEQSTLPSLLPLTLSASGVPFNAKQDQPILMSAYGQYFLSLLRILRMNFCQRDVLRMIKTGLTDLQPEEVMEMENYARENGIHRGRWLKPFYIPEKEGRKEKALLMEDLRQLLINPLVELKRQLSRKNCTGIQAATLLFRFITDAGIYTRLQQQEEVLAGQGDDLAIDRNRQVWSAVNELLDTVATFIGDETLPMPDLCAMLEACLSSRMIKSLPQRSGAVMVAPPQMFFSSGIRCMIVMGLQENEVAAGASALTEQERQQLEAYIETVNRETAEKTTEARPFSKIGQSLMDLAARQKQDVYQAVSLAREELMISCSGAKPSGGVLTPSTAFERLVRTVQKVNPDRYSGGLMNPDLRPFAPAFALETLAVRLRDARNSADSFLLGSGEEDRQWKYALGALYRSDDWRPRVEGMLKGLHIEAPSASISPEEAKRLYLSHGMTISRVETFASCPYRHLLQYGLDLFPDGMYTFQRNEQGTFNHDVLKLFLDRAMRRPEWPELSEETQTRLLNQILREQVRAWEGGILTSDTPHRYQGAEIIRGIRTSIASLMRSFQRKPHFLPIAVEIPFGMPDETGKTRLPALQIRTADGETVAFSGRIDRIDALRTESGKRYFLVTDNKMSSREVRQNSIIEGLQLQLPLYVRAAQIGMKEYEAAGGIYQPIREAMVQSDDPERVNELIDRELQTAGMILDDKLIQEAMRPVKIGKRQDTNDIISAVSGEEMNRIMDCAMEAVTDRVNRIRSGEVTPRPIRDGMEAPCAWCDYVDACRYDSTLPGCRIREVNHKHRMPLG